MTISELAEQYRKVNDTRDELQKQSDAIGRVITLMETGKVDPKVVDKARAEFYPMSAAIHEAQKQLVQYSLLLDSIMRTSRITWPPECASLKDDP